MEYIVKRIDEKSEIEHCQKFSMHHYMWNSTQNPNMYGWMAYLKDRGLYVKMVCEEKDPKRVFKQHRDRVYEDSAVEVFLAFTEENEELTNDCMYLNFEFNANGAMYAKYGKGRKNRQFLSDEECQMVEIKSAVYEEQWELELLISELFLEQVCDWEKMKAGKKFYCNFYKISENKEIEHYGSYTLIDSPTPNFHLPVCFAEATIE